MDGDSGEGDDDDANVGSVASPFRATVNERLRLAMVLGPTRGVVEDDDGDGGGRYMLRARDRGDEPRVGDEDNEP